MRKNVQARCILSGFGNLAIRRGFRSLICLPRGTAPALCRVDKLAPAGYDDPKDGKGGWR